MANLFDLEGLSRVRVKKDSKAIFTFFRTRRKEKLIRFSTFLTLMAMERLMKMNLSKDVLWMMNWWIS